LRPLLFLSQHDLQLTLQCGEHVLYLLINRAVIEGSLVRPEAEPNGVTPLSLPQMTAPIVIEKAYGFKMFDMFLHNISNVGECHPVRRNDAKITFDSGIGDYV
jgi:hypothetical protein